ncbi:verprolin-like [Varroa destructor]|uniref:SH3 domain-containing protein n=1 Tax=Varroa destructor TaxID=109461 RepID=A0A7M7MFE7_VARDE|nr:verprolin-like [Varroa destructor]
MERMKLSMENNEMSASCKPSRAAPPPPVPSHAPNANHHSNRSHFNGDRNNNRSTATAKIPTVIRPKMVETPTKKAPPRPPPPRVDYVPTRTTSLSKTSVGPPPAVPTPPAHKTLSKGNTNHKGLHINTAKALRRVKIFGQLVFYSSYFMVASIKSSVRSTYDKHFSPATEGYCRSRYWESTDYGQANTDMSYCNCKSTSGGSSKSSTSNANSEFVTSGLGGGYGSYTNQALSQPPRTNSKKQAPLPPRGQNGFGGGSHVVATGTLISLDTPPSSPGAFGTDLLLQAPASKNHIASNNVQSLLDVDFPEPVNTSEGCLLDMDIPPLISTISTSMSVDNFGSTPFDPFVSQAQQPQLNRKLSLPAITGSLVQPLLPFNGTSSRISQIREESNAVPPGSPPPPRGPAPQLHLHDTSVVHPNPCGMALQDHQQPATGELAFSQYDLIELVSDHNDRYYMCRLDDQEGLVRKNALEILTPLEDSQQDSEPECLQDVWRSGGINKHQSTNLCNVNVIILFYAVFFCCLGFFYYCYISMFIVVPLLGLSLLSMLMDVASLSIHNVNSDKCYTIPPGDAGACAGFAKLIVGGVMLGPRSPALVLLCFAVIHSWSQWIVWREGGE